MSFQKMVVYGALVMVPVVAFTDGVEAAQLVLLFLILLIVAERAERP